MTASLSDTKGDVDGKKEEESREEEDHQEGFEEEGKAQEAGGAPRLGPELQRAGASAPALAGYFLRVFGPLRTEMRRAVQKSQAQSGFRR